MQMCQQAQQNYCIFPDFLPMFIYALSHCGVVSAEIEADYMWGLLHPCLVAGEGGYHLTTLSSAVHVLKNLINASTLCEKHQMSNLSQTVNEGKAL